VEKGQEVTDAIGLTAIAPTVFKFLDIPVQEAWGWEGKPFAVKNSRENLPHI
jgi:hypothetical protein